MVRGGQAVREDNSLFFLRLRGWGVSWVRLGMGGEYEGGEWGLQVEGQAEGIFWGDRGGVNVASNTEESEEARQRASLFSSVVDFAFSFRGGGSENHMSKLRGIWGDEGVIGGQEAGNGILEDV